MKLYPRSITLVLGVVVGLATILIGVRFARVPPAIAVSDARRVFGELRALEVPDWEVSELPLGATEGERQAVEKTLQFDDAIFLRLRHGMEDVGVYVAYWGPGKGDLRSVGMHTPDTCWVRAGWEPIMRESDFRGEAGGQLPPGQYRSFAMNGTIQYVVFWHMLHGESVPLWRNGFPSLPFLLRKVGSDLRHLSGEQYFIRISSPRPLTDQWDSPGLQKVLSILAETGLRPRPTWRAPH